MRILREKVFRSASLHNCSTISRLIALLMLAPSVARGATLTTLASFDGRGNGSQPVAGLTVDATGNFYGTTAGGGTSGNGTVFKLSSSGTLSTLAAFNGFTDGGQPASRLVADAMGNFYGTAQTGGAFNHGTVFRLSGDGVITVLVSFTGLGNGSQPTAGLIADSAGNLYGTTRAGGSFDDGTVFRLSAEGIFSTLATFNGVGTGAYPIADLVADAAGNLYGTTSGGGGSNLGTVFRLSAAGELNTLVTFNGASNGQQPYSGLIGDPAGGFYGTTSGGGAFNRGTIFKLSSSGTLSTLASFTGGIDGGAPASALIADAAGNLFGTTFQGGQSVFKLSSMGVLSAVANFTGGVDGDAPTGRLIADATGNLYGTTQRGGASGFGTVFRLSDAGFVTSVPSAVPEPASWTLMVVGFGLLGIAARRRWPVVAA